MGAGAHTSMRTHKYGTPHGRPGAGGRSAALLVLLLTVLLAASCGRPKPSALPEVLLPPEDWGIRPVGLFILDWGLQSEFRYRVTDAEAALFLLSKPAKVFLVRESNGERHELPLPARTGNLELLEFDPDPRRIYYIRLNHPVLPIARGERMSLVIGDMRAQGLEARAYDDMPPDIDTGLPPATPETVVTVPDESAIAPFGEIILDDGAE